jgi:hypothetical protein
MPYFTIACGSCDCFTQLGLYCSATSPSNPTKRRACSANPVHKDLNACYAPKPSWLCTEFIDHGVHFLPMLLPVYVCEQDTHLGAFVLRALKRFKPLPSRLGHEMFLSHM